MSEKFLTFVMCHDQNIIFDSVNNELYKDNVKFLFLGKGEVDKIKSFDDVIICRDLEFNIEEYKNCLQYCAWYAVLKNNLLGDHEYVRFIDYDIDINNKISVTKDVKGTIAYDWEYYFYTGFGDSEKFQNHVKEISNKTIFELIETHQTNFGQTKWFSSIDTIMKRQFYFDFMMWFDGLYEKYKNEYYFGMHFERYLTIYCLIKNVDYEISFGETTHKQLKSHNYY